ncbi:MAG: hypothetical protein ABSB70_13370 [Candidatus Velthaea sp.]
MSVTRYALATGVGGALLAAGACAAGAPHGGGPSPAPHPTSIIERMGVVTNAAGARHGIAFVPFMPPRRILSVALLPPFHGDDTRANRGLGLEYEDLAARRYALAEWPANGGTLTRFAPLDQPELGCADARTFSRGTRPNGIVWSTSSGLIMTLQADGANDARTLELEWRKLIRRGACR